MLKTSQKLKCTVCTAAWFMSSEMFFIQLLIGFASLNTLQLVSCTLEFPRGPLQVYAKALCAQKDADVIMIQFLQGKLHLLDTLFLHLWLLLFCFPDSKD